MSFKIVALLVLSTVAGFAIAYVHGSQNALQDLVLVVIGVTLSGSGAELSNKVLEKDIDKKMKRTSRRPTVKGEISPGFALAFGLFISTLGAVLGYLVNPLTAVMIILGVAFYLIVYTKLLKTRSRFSILIGGFAGSFCVWAGVTAAANTITLPGLILGLLVLFWIPGHIWSLVIKYEKDYLEAGVPMYTAVVSERRGASVIAFFNILMAVLSIYLVTVLGLYYLAIIAIPLAISLYLSLKTMANSAAAWSLFKFSSIYLAFVFLAVILVQFL
jgi:protoheme IX farnesyltransferase